MNSRRTTRIATVAGGGAAVTVMMILINGMIGYAVRAGECRRAHRAAQEK
ncbi:hypothetical protein [Leisingera sp. McT4-56]|nr:hypothetical protein [Leisingera sp. McT4-56]MCB4456880.1 hypothetical protein [Leisingera sp. McT4-56]